MNSEHDRPDIHNPTVVKSTTSALWDSWPLKGERLGFLFRAWRLSFPANVKHLSRLGVQLSPITNEPFVFHTVQELMR